ncbi:MAG: hypothetical protein WKG07_03705 [Hymenobacter sp.]
MSLMGFAAVGASPGPDGAGLVLWLLTVLSYCAFWWARGVGRWPRFNRDSAVNALAAVGLWLLFLLVRAGRAQRRAGRVRPVDSAAAGPAGAPPAAWTTSRTSGPCGPWCAATCASTPAWPRPAIPCLQPDPQGQGLRRLHPAQRRGQPPR